MLTKLSPPEIYAQLFGIFDVKTSNFNCGDYSNHRQELESASSVSVNKKIDCLIHPDSFNFKTFQKIVVKYVNISHRAKFVIR
jgi:hypothetical protein